MSNVGGNPANPTYWNIVLNSFASGNAVQGMIAIDVDYTCEFLEPFPPSDI